MNSTAIHFAPLAALVLSLALVDHAAAGDKQRNTAIPGGYSSQFKPKFMRQQRQLPAMDYIFEDALILQGNDRYPTGQSKKGR
jgi:hypothetical protein